MFRGGVVTIYVIMEKGASFPGGVVDDDGMLALAFFSDPDGNPLYLAEMKGAHK